MVRGTQLALIALLVGTTLAGPPKASCTKASQTAYFVVDNTELVTKDAIKFEEFSEEECQSTCSSNIDRKGNSLECASFAYDHVTFTCTIYSTKAAPSGDGKASHSVGRRYFEKFCLPENAAPRCSEAQFIRADDSVLVGFAANVSLVDTIDDCVATCVDEPACKSAMYFYEEGECITNTESALSRPEAFAREDSEKVIYFQNGCLARTAFVESSTAPAAVDFESESKPRNSKYALSESAERPISESIESEQEEEVTSTIPAKTTTTSAPADNHDEYDDEHLEDEETSPLPKKKSSSRRTSAEELKKYKKHPKNFGTKTVAYKQEKGAKAGVPKIDSLEEEVDPSVSTSEEEPAEKSGDPYTAFFSDWSDWTPCKTVGERRIRRRKCLDLRRCLGALMQVESCSAPSSPTPELITEEQIKSMRSIVAAPLEGDPLAGIDSVTSSPSLDSEIAPAGTADLGNSYIWSPWLGTCQKFASGQPCNEGEMIGFESRECVAKDPGQCQGPFFRYCTLPC